VCLSVNQSDNSLSLIHAECFGRVSYCWCL